MDTSLRAIPQSQWLNEQIFGRLAFNERFFPNTRTPICCLLYGLKGSGKTSMVKQISEKLKARLVDVYESKLFSGRDWNGKENLSDRLAELFKMAANDGSQAIIFHFRDCTRLFKEVPFLDQLLVSEIQSFKTATTTLFCFFSTCSPATVPKALMNVLTGVPIFIPYPSNAERRTFLTARVTQLNKLLLKSKCNEEEMKQLLSQVPSARVINKIVLSSEGCSYRTLSEFVNNVFSAHCLEMQNVTRSPSLSPNTIIPGDLYYERFAKSLFVGQRCSDEDVQSMIEFGEPFGFGSAIRNSILNTLNTPKIPDLWLPFIERISEKRKNKSGEWECRVVWKDYWIPVDQCAFTESSFQQLDDTGDTEASQEPSQLSSQNSFNTQDLLNFDSQEVQTTGKRKRSQKIDYNESPFEERKKIKPTAIQKEKRRIFASTPSPVKSPSTRFMHNSYNGALAFALLKAKQWSKDDTEVLDVSDSTSGGSVYDWDIVWLAMKIIFKTAIKFEGTISAARKSFKNHTKIQPYLAEWRKNRTTNDDELKELFHVADVTSQSKLDEFMEMNKEWSEEDEESFLGLSSDDAFEKDVQKVSPRILRSHTKGDAQLELL